MLNLRFKNNQPSESTDTSTLRSVASTVALILLAPAIALFISAFILQSYQVDGESMETTLQNGDRLLVNKLPRTWARLTHHAYVPHRGNIIIFNQSGLDIGFVGDKQLIKRVIGLPGERVVVKDNQVTIYNKVHSEGFNPDLSGLYHLRTVQSLGNVDVTLGPSEIFVCGDNRPNSEDSRYFGPIDVRNVVGIMSVRVLPLGEPHHP